LDLNMFRIVRLRRLNGASFVLRASHSECIMELLAATTPLALPEPRVKIAVRVASLADLPAIDRLQKLHHKQLGFFPRAQMEGYLKNEWVIVAESVGSRQQGAGSNSGTGLPTAWRLQPTLLGYCASRDRYQKRDELGAIFQLCVDPSAQRMFVGANLLRAVFERAPYGCKLFCCWCAQDIAANFFWEAMGFVPLAFRAGSREKGRVHIFWQKRIREGDTVTPWWFPCQTSAGSIREDRLVLPIPPGLRWNDEMPRVLPQQESPKLEAQVPKQIEDFKPRVRAKTSTVLRKALGGWSFTPPAEPETVRSPSSQRPPRMREKNDPKLIAAVRELRDRWLERVNSGEDLLPAEGKYELSRFPLAPHGNFGELPRLLPAGSEADVIPGVKAPAADAA
jgi:ribosomal protein S18 acetylase RimI-like enzyme